MNQRLVDVFACVGCPEATDGNVEDLRNPIRLRVSCSKPTARDFSTRSNATTTSPIYAAPTSEAHGRRAGYRVPPDSRHCPDRISHCACPNREWSDCHRRLVLAEPTAGATRRLRPLDCHSPRSRRRPGVRTRPRRTSEHRRRRENRRDSARRAPLRGRHGSATRIPRWRGPNRCSTSRDRTAHVTRSHRASCRNSTPRRTMGSSPCYRLHRHPHGLRCVSRNNSRQENPEQNQKQPQRRERLQRRNRFSSLHLRPRCRRGERRRAFWASSGRRPRGLRSGPPRRCSAGRRCWTRSQERRAKRVGDESSPSSRYRHCASARVRGGSHIGRQRVCRRLRRRHRIPCCSQPPRQHSSRPGPR